MSPATGLLGALALSWWLASQQPLTVYVSPNGDDRWSGAASAHVPGTADGPLRSLHAARERVRKLQASHPNRPIRVVVAPGVYGLREPLVLGPRDSGSPGAPVTWVSAQPGAAVLTGGRIVRGWRPWRGQIFRTDIKAQGIPLRRYHQLFYRGRRQPLARHPNFDPKHPRTGGFLYVYDRGVKNHEQFVYAPGDLPLDKWPDVSQAEVFCINHGGWTVTITPIVSIDPRLRLITVRRARADFRELNRYFVQNVLGALDAPGEWFLDYRTGELYFWPPDGRQPGDNVTLPVLDNVIELRGSVPYPPGRRDTRLPGRLGLQVKEPRDVPDRPVHDIVIQGFSVQCARRDGVRLVGARDCRVIGCTVRDVGGVGINLGGVVPLYPDVGNPREGQPKGLPGGVGGAGQDLYFQYPCHSCRVAGNDVYSTGSDGIFLYGHANVAENNHVFDVGLYDKDCAGINLWGRECVARRNFIHDVPRNAVFLKGTRHVVELNEIRYTMLETCDGGAIRMCQRDFGLRGCVIRFNRIRDTVGYGYPRGSLRYMAPYYSWAVYLDDYTCGTAVRGNIIARTGRGGIMVHGGSDNVLEGNIIVDAGFYMIEVVPIDPKQMSGNAARRNVLVFDGAKAVAYRCARWRPEHIRLERNLVWGRGKPVRVDLGSPKRLFADWESWLAAGIDQGSICADPRFIKPQADDFRMAADSPARRVGFRDVPVERIGCYRSPERASWPLGTPRWLVREQPVLHRCKPRPLREDFELEQPGRRPRHGDVMDAPEARIVVSDERALSGRMSLKFTDAAGLRFAWMPRIYYSLRPQDGWARLSCSFWLDPQRPPRVLLDPRQYSGAGPEEYFSGPMLTVTPDGQLTAAGGQTLGRVPLGQWFTLTLWLQVGGQDQVRAPAELKTADGTRTRFTVPFASEKFRRPERLVICCPGEEPAMFFVDDVIFEPAPGGPKRN